MASAAVRWDEDGVEIRRWPLSPSRIDWSSLLALRTQKGRTVFVHETEGGRIHQIQRTMKVEDRHALDEAWFGRQLAELEGTGEHRTRACPRFGASLVLAFGLLTTVMVGAAAVGALSAEPIPTMVLVLQAVFAAIFGLAFAGALRAWLGSRRWARAVYDRDGVTRTDSAGRVHSIPWHRVRLDRGRLYADDVPLPLEDLSGEPLARLLVSTKAHRAPSPQPLGLFPIRALRWLLRRTIRREVATWTARYELLAARCDWIEPAPGLTPE